VVEVALAGKPSSRFPFRTTVHYLLPRGENGFFAWVVYQHDRGMAATGLGQTRFVIKGVPRTRLFTHHVVDDRRMGPVPTAKIEEKVQDATYRLEGGLVYTKYDNCVYEADHHLHGVTGNGLGLWMIYPSNEFLGGGPIKQNLTVHMEAMNHHVVLGMLQSGHFGSGGLRFAEGERWTKVFGPLFVYVNKGASTDALWQDASKRARTERARWPYPWLKHPSYPLQRGIVTGRVRLTDGGSTSGAWTILAPPGEDWTRSSKGYHFWTRLDGMGRFSLTGVRPGRYTLFVSGANQFEDFRRDGVEVKAGKATALGNLPWKTIKHGRTLWQIGVADRSSREFRGGDNYRHYGNFLRYPKEFPDDVTFIVGKSKEDRDWNFAQWSWYSKRPFWTIRFDLAEAPGGKATLTIGFASVHPSRGPRSNLQVKVNGKEVATVRLPKSGTAGYRSGSQDSTCNVVYLPFDAGLLRKGANEITLGHAEALPFSAPLGKRRRIFGQVMYDSLRLEIDSTARMTK
jgi:rhamnogalacturonan endolyase